MPVPEALSRQIAGVAIAASITLRGTSPSSRQRPKASTSRPLPSALVMIAAPGRARPVSWPGASRSAFLGSTTIVCSLLLVSHRQLCPAGGARRGRDIAVGHRVVRGEIRRGSSLSRASIQERYAPTVCSLPRPAAATPTKLPGFTSASGPDDKDDPRRLEMTVHVAGAGSHRRGFRCPVDTLSIVARVPSQPRGRDHGRAEPE